MARILIVDDEPDFCSELRIVLEDGGHAVASAANGAEGLKSLADEPFDLLITDILMPDVDGIELIRAYRDRRENAKILVMSGAHWSVGDPLAMAESLGATDSIRKPFRSAALLDKVSQMLAATD